MAEAMVAAPTTMEMTTPPKVWKGWGSSPTTTPSSVPLCDIMSEQLAASLQGQEEERFLVQELLLPSEDDDVGAVGGSFLTTPSDDTSSDEMIARMLQIQFSREHDQEVKREEKNFNGFSKVSVSLNKYLMSPPGIESEDDDESDLPPPKVWDSFEAHEKAFPQLPRCGYKKVDGVLVTKHDVTMNGRRNACKVMESFPPCITTGDTGAFDLQLSNKVYNNLRAYSKSEENRRNRMHDKKEKATNELAIDARTRLLLYKLINSTVLENIYGIISTGKEAVVLFATGGRGDAEELMKNGEKLEIPSECAVKVFKTSLNEFKTRDKYIKDDYRFKERFSKQNPRKVIHLWAEKELHNLSRISKAGIPCPSVVLLKKHILVMSFIGTDTKPAPKLKEVTFSSEEELESAYKQVLDIVIRLYNQCNLIHADLSEYNILWHQEKCWLIDVSQSVEPSHPHALEFLYRDCTNITNFFAKKGVNDCHSPESLFTEITGYPLEDGSGGAEILSQIQNFEKDLELLTFAKEEKPFAFEHCWEEANSK